MITFCVAILSFVWRTGAANNSFSPLTARQALGPRVAISAVFAFGLFNFWMILRTFHTYSHIAVRRDRRSRFGRHGEDRDRGRQRGGKGPAGVSESEEKAHGKLASESMVGLGLGLTGLSGESGSAAPRQALQGSPASVSAILEDADVEKGEGAYLASERVGAVLGRRSPRMSPKL